MAGIVIGVLAAVALGAYLAFLLVKRRKREALMPRDSGTFAMPNFNDGEFGRYVCHECCTFLELSSTLDAALFCKDEPQLRYLKYRQVDVYC